MFDLRSDALIDPPSYSKTWKILRKDLGVKPFKIQLLQELKPNDLPQRRIFGEWALGKLSEDPRLNGYVNKHNCRFCSEDQPEELQKLPMHPEQVKKQ